MVTLTSLPATPARVALPECRLEPEEVLERIASEGVSGLVCLWGDWFGGGVLIAYSPLTTRSTPGPATDLADDFEDQPQILEPGPAGLVGGGWVGVLGYDAGTSRAAFHDFVIRRDSSGQWWFETLGLPGRETAVATELQRCRELIMIHERRSDSGEEPDAFGTVVPVDGAELEHLAAVEEAIGRIHRGDFYQVNLCTRLSARFSGRPVPLFGKAAAALQPAYGAYVDAGDRQLMSFSPELFLRQTGRHVSTSPIKGTAPRRDGETESAALQISTKDQAENIMIVDLMRNDLSRVAASGTVRVDRLLAVEPHPGVWHLVSTVSADLMHGVGTAGLLRAAFPPGSVTGAPKSAAVRAIADIEPTAREVYTGAIGWVSPVAGAEFNVAIRTFELTGDRLALGVGGGITVDSVPMLEWRECLHKAAPLITAIGSRLDPALTMPASLPTSEQLEGGVFESMLAVDGRILRLSGHLARLDRSCRELYSEGIPPGLAATAQGQTGAGTQAVRVHAVPAADGLTFTVTTTVLGARTPSRSLVVARRPAGLWRHKWRQRLDLEAAEREAAGAAPVFIADDGAVLETSRGNIFLRAADGTWMTPELRDDLLPGVTRRAVLDLADELGILIRIRSFHLAELEAATAAFWTSSLSLVVPVTSFAGRRLGQAPEVEMLSRHLLGGRRTRRG